MTDDEARAKAIEEWARSVDWAAVTERIEQTIRELREARRVSREVWEAPCTI